MSSISKSLMGHFFQAQICSEKFFRAKKCLCPPTKVNMFNYVRCPMENSMTLQNWPAVDRQNICFSHPLCHKAVEGWGTHFNLLTMVCNYKCKKAWWAGCIWPSLCILQADNSQMRCLSQSRRRLSCSFGSSQSYLGSLALRSSQSDNRTLVPGVKKDTRYLALSHANVKSGLFFPLVAKVFEILHRYDWNPLPNGLIII